MKVPDADAKNYHSPFLSIWIPTVDSHDYAWLLAVSDAAQHAQMPSAKCKP